MRELLTLARRFLTLAALMFWQGGFVFYAGVVVPIGTDVLGSAVDQGFITRRVSDALNLSGAVALTILALDVATTSSDGSRLRLLRWLTWLGMMGLLAALAVLRPRMDVYLDFDVLAVTDRQAFRFLHRSYLWLITVQWSFGIVFALLTLAAWRREDRQPAPLRPLDVTAITPARKRMNHG